MPGARKKSPSKGTAFLDRDRYTAELTSGQLVFGISILLVFGLTCFLLGVLVGRFEPVPPTEVAAASNGETEGAARGPNGPNRRSALTVAPPEEDAKPRAEPTTSGEGRQTSPRTDMLDAAAETDDKPDTQVASRPKPKDLTGPKPVVFPEDKPEAARQEPAENAGESSAKGSQQSSDEKPERAIVEFEPAEEPDAPAPPSAEKPKAPKPEAEPTAEPEPDRVAAAETPERPDTATPAPAESSSGAKAAFSIQMAAMSKRPNADALKRTIEQGSSYPVEILAIERRGLNLVLAGAFDNRSDAEKALHELRTIFPEFSDAFIRARK